MKLLYRESPIPNFGDDINELLWEALVPGIFDQSDDTGFMGIGGLIGASFKGIERLHVFSSGIGGGRGELPTNNMHVWCVRGPFSAHSMNLDASRIVTDGALLAPLIWPAAKQRQQVVVIPDWRSLYGKEAFWNQACSLAGFKLVSPMQRVDRVLADISSASLVLTESLHGAILADAYGVPWKAWASTDNFSLIEWGDWAASMDVPLCVSGIAAPCSGIVKQYGRAAFASGQIDVPVSADNVVSAISASDGDLTSARRSLVKLGFDKIALSGMLGATLSGYKPAETAKGLVAVAMSAEAQLSAEDRRARLTQKLLDLLREVAVVEGISDEASQLFGQ